MSATTFRLTVVDDRAFISQSVASPEGESMLIPLGFAVMIFLTGFAFGDATSDTISGHMLDLIAGVSCLATFWVLRGLRRRFGRQSARGNISMWALSGIVAACTPNLAFVVARQPVPSIQMDTLPVGMIAYAWIVIASGLVVSNWLGSRSRMRDLLAHQQVLMTRQARFAEEVTLIREAMKREIGLRLKTSLESIEARIAISDASSRSIAAADLRAVIDDVIRPLSWTLATSPNHNSELSQDRDASNMARKVLATAANPGVDPALPRTIPLARLATPVLFAIFAIVTTVISAWIVDGIPGLGAALVSLLFNMTFLMLVRYSNTTRRFSFLIGIMTMTAIATVLSCVSPLLLTALNSPLESGFSIALGFSLVALLSASFMAFAARRNDHIAALEEINLEMDLLVSDLRQQTWVARSELARTVHGTVQGKLLVAALRLAQMDSDDSPYEAMSDIQAALDSIEHGDEPESIPVRQALKDLVESWASVCEVQIDATDEVLDRIDSSITARACVMEVLREATANAAKHSRSRKLVVELSEPDRSHIGIVCRNEGSLSSSGGSGYGSQILDDVTTDWSLAEKSGALELHARVVLSAG